ncbi:hypothetical protein [Jiangella gansuensis]|uniref:hypothetical protein n=1 Tax=Jiangella gansuensis TaxID=281473 RepID=UPI0012FB9099|nr:hypothetical protein [Jiangella gansuensis]
MQELPSQDARVDLVHFLIPLEDALAFPDGFVQRLEEAAMIDDLIAASASGQDLDIGDTVHWVSLKFWHQETDASIDILRAINDVARRAIPTLAPTNDGSYGERPAVPITVVECVAPLRTDIDDEAAISEAFDECLNSIRLVQRAYRATTGLPAALATRERMPVMLPFAHRSGVTAENPAWPDGLEIFVPHDNIYRLARYPDLSTADLQRFQHVLQAIDSHRVFSRFADLRQQVWQLARRQGEYETAVILAGTATETLLDDLLISLAWEERMPPVDVGTLFDSGLEWRIRSQYHNRLGGVWNLDRPGALATWRRDLAALRHRVVHAAYTVRHEEANAAARAMEDVFSFVSDRLATPQNIRRWPRTAIGLLGTARLEELGLLTRRTRDLLTDPNEPNWAATFLRYQIAVAHARSDAAELFDAPDEARSVVFALIQPDGRVSWWLHDRTARCVRQCLRPELPEEQEASFENWRAGIPLVDLTEPVTMVMMGATSSPVHGSHWHPEYKVLPLEGIMVDRSDLADLDQILAEAT